MDLDYKVYILKSLKNGHYYIGQTENLAKRLKEHNSGKSKSTKSGIPWALAHKEIYETRSESIRRERQLKKIKKRYIIERLIAG
ncbi:MAG: GIY-YIG nuclease family protein [Candidatus Omnitrophica bacterium]|nr:GIY-YIG nuclease family protein [Candidatus Omnitrophota bacterium]